MLFRIKTSFLRGSIVIFFIHSLDVFADITSTQSSTSGQRDLTVDDINKVKELLFNQPIKPYSITVYGLLQAASYFADTSRNNSPDFGVKHTRFGIFAVESHWSGKLEVEFLGDQPKVLFPSSNTIYLNQSGNNTVKVRQAQINFDYFNQTVAQNFSGSEEGLNEEALVGMDTSPPGEIEVPEKPSESGKNAKELKVKKAKKVNKSAQKAPNRNTPISLYSYFLSREFNFILRFSIGGIRLNSARAVAPDPANTPSGYGRQDGVYLGGLVTFKDLLAVNLGFGVFNTIFTTNTGKLGQYQGWGVYPATAFDFLGVLGTTSSSFSKAFEFTSNITWYITNKKNLNILSFLAFQGSAPVNTNENGFAISIRNALHAEASITYNDLNVFGDQALMTGNGVSFWYEVEYGTDQVKTPAALIGFTVPSPGDGYLAVLYGLGVGGDTTPFFTNKLKKGDRLLYSASVTFVSSQFRHPGPAPTGYSPNYYVTQFAGSFGYGYKSLEIALATQYSMSAQTPFTHFNLNTNPLLTTSLNNNYTAYLTAAIYF